MTSRLRRNLPSRTPRRGRRPRRPFRRMTDDVITMRKLSPHVVGRTVLGAPPSRDCRAALDAAARPDRPHPRHPRRANLASTTPRMQIPRAQPAHHFVRAHLCRPSSQPRAGVEARPYGGMGLTGNVGTPHPRCTNPSVTAQSAATAPLSGEPRSGWRFAAFAHLFTAMLIPTFS